MVAVAASGLQGPCRQICGSDQGSGIQTKKTASRKVSLYDFPTSSDSDTESQAQPPLQKQFSNPLE